MGWLGSLIAFVGGLNLICGDQSNRGLIISGVCIVIGVGLAIISKYVLKEKEED